MNIEIVKTAMIEQYKEMCEEFSKTPIIKEPIFTYLGPMWDANAMEQRRFAAGQCEGGTEIVRTDTYERRIQSVDRHR